MGTAILGIGTSGLLASQQQIQTAGHNISNANTAGYARQRTSITNRDPQYVGTPGYVGSGVKVVTTTRFYDQFLEDQIQTTNSQLGRLERFNELSSQIDNIVANPDAGLTVTMESFYNALQEANDFPGALPSRSVLLTSANTMVDRFQLIYKRFDDLNNQVNRYLTDLSTEISTRAQSIAELNTQIVRQIGTAQGNLPNDAMDQREQLIKEIAQRVDVSVVSNANGSVNVFIGNGQSLVLEDKAFTMSVQNNKYTQRDQDIYLSNATNGSVDVSSQITGGQMQGVLDFKSKVLEPSIAALGRIAASVSKEMNEQHQLGLTLRQDPNNRYLLGANFFQDITTSIDTLPSTANTGTADFKVQIIDSKDVTTGDYELSFTTAGGYVMKRLSDGVTFSGATLADLNNNLANVIPNSLNTPQGIQLNLAAGAVANGDTFLVRPTHGLARVINTQVSDVLDIALASPITIRQALDSDNPAVTNPVGVGTNTGSAAMNFKPFVANGTAIANIPITSGAAGAGNDVNVVLTYDSALSQFNVTTTGTPVATATPAVTLATIPYSAATTGQTFSLSAPYADISFTITGVPNNGDSFVIGNNASPQDDNRNGLIMSAVQTKKTLQNSSADFQSAYGDMVSNVGTRTHASAIDLAAQTTLNEQAQANRDTLSGVNLDEEASDLLRFQQTYQASARVINIADKLFNDLLNNL